MKVSTVFKPLFKITIHHNYFLNDGDEDFVDMEDDKKQAQLKTFNWDSFLKIEANHATSKLLFGHNIVVKTFPDHLVLALKVKPEDDKIPFIEFDKDEELVFELKVKDPFFWNYTNLPYSGEELLYFSNKAPLLPNPNNFKSIPKSQQKKLINSDYLFDSANKMELLKQTGIGESEAIGIIRLHMQSNNTADSLIQQNGKLKNQLPHFKIHFDNQKTIWKYIHHKGAFVIETKDVKPLTQYGFIQLDSPSDFKGPVPDMEDYKFPNPNPLHIKSIGNKLYSEIFI
ncbi:hypothetical protein [Echinicola salinicaeni]|uniref:hypothetical protein n=1 Tax=Echinicola salinicaeni TaxID=2762757 RepID=UPI0016445FEF|nr:hypothetical protein [Echinicola salinicaeni]